MSLNPTIKKELNEILTTFDLIKKKQIKKEVITTEEIISSNAAIKNLTKIVEIHSIELKHQFEISLKTAPKDILEKFSRKLGENAFGTLVRLVNNNKHIKPDAMPVDICCICIAVGTLTENWWVWVTFGECCEMELEA